MRIEVKSSEVQLKAGTSKRTGKPYSIREQSAYLHVAGEAYPVRCVLQVEENAEPFAPGLYDTADELRVGDFGRLAVSRGLRLVPAKRAS